MGKSNNNKKVSGYKGCHVDYSLIHLIVNPGIISFTFMLVRLDVVLVNVHQAAALISLSKTSLFILCILK